MALIFIVRMVDSKNDSNKGSKGWIGFAIAGSVDLLIDGFLMGVAFSVSHESGILLTIAIAFEVLFLGFTFSISFGNKGLQKLPIFLIVCSMAALLFVGGVLGYWVLGVLEPNWKVAAMAFGAVALLYIVSEDLLVEAHEDGETAMGPC
jgi:ZIP family zinc transporter